MFIGEAPAKKNHANGRSWDVPVDARQDHRGHETQP
jgi:hypothetical protein